jgi:O-antigen ligase
MLFLRNYLALIIAVFALYILSVLLNNHIFSWKFIFQTVSLLLLSCLVLQTVAIPAKQLFTVAVILITVLAFCGFLQYFNVFSFRHNSFITGTFDNPAGFTAALSCVFPYTFLFFRNFSCTVKYISLSIAVFILSVILISEARAAIVAVFAVAVCYLLNVRSGIKLKKQFKILILCTFAIALTGFYFLKKDSADGRILIWKNTLEMIADQPVTGHGHGVFQAKYMLYQAKYFDAHGDGSKYAGLADNVLHPFNEYLLVLSEYGIIGLLCLAALALIILKIYLRNRSTEKFIALLSLTVIAIISCFSYPFKYPFTWIIAFLDIALIFGAEKTFSCRLTYAVKTCTFLCAAGVMFSAILLIKAEIQWNTIAKQSLAGKTKEMLPEYEKLYKYLDNIGLFLYNHAAELHQAGEYEKSLAVFEKCIKYYNDCDVQMLVADCYKELGDFKNAEKHLKTAAAMIPVRFVPLYRLTELYIATGRTGEALTLANKILDKTVKVPSATIDAIKNKMRRLLEGKDCTTVPATENRTDVKPLKILWSVNDRTAGLRFLHPPAEM